MFFRPNIVPKPCNEIRVDVVIPEILWGIGGDSSVGQRDETVRSGSNLVSESIFKKRKRRWQSDRIRNRIIRVWDSGVLVVWTVPQCEKNVKKGPISEKTSTDNYFLENRFLKTFFREQAFF